MVYAGGGEEGEGEEEGDGRRFGEESTRPLANGFVLENVGGGA